MKKYLPIFVTIFIFSILSTSAQIKEGDSFVDVYYGFPDWQEYIFKTDNPGNGSYSNINVSSTGHIGGRVEHMISKRIGFGLDLWYVKTSMTANRTDKYTMSNYNYTNGNYTTTTTINKYELEKSLSRLALLGRFVIHLGNSAKIDPYIHMGFGYVNYNHKYSLTNTYSSNGQPQEDDVNSNDNFVPIGARVGFGMRIFFTENFGANFDLGLGGALFTTGLTYRFPNKQVAVQ